MLTFAYNLQGLFFLIFSLLTACHALLNKQDSKAALGWIACCVLIPYLGPVLYIVFGINRAESSAKRMRPLPDEEDHVMDSGSGQEHPCFRLAGIGYNVTGKNLLPGQDLDILYNGDGAYPAMLNAIENAKISIYLATYIFANGAVSNRFIDVLVEAQNRGVDVRIILDGMGERMSFPRIGNTLKKRGLPFVRFNKLTLLPLSLHINLRNHRKLLIVDSHTAFTGGINIADRNIHEGKNDSDVIQDIHFLLTGGIVADLEYTFLKDWNYCLGHLESRDYDFPPMPITQPEDHAFWTRVVLDGPNEDLNKLKDILIGTFSSARERIWIMTPYFLPDSSIIAAMQGARLRNVEVTVCLTSHNNIPITHWATRNLLWKLLDYGVKVYYQRPPFSHAKLLLIDDDYSLVGSANMDPRSMRLNYELSVEIFSKDTNRQLAGYFQEKIQDASVCTREMMRNRPLPVRMRDALAWLWSPYL